MRTKPFTFTKTKTVKQKVQHRAISVDLTEQEASDLVELLGAVGNKSAARTETYDPLYRAIQDFLGGYTEASKRRRVNFSRCAEAEDF